MRSSSVNWLSRSSGSSHLNAASLIWALFGSRLSVFSATCDIACLPGSRTELKAFSSPPETEYQRRSAPVAQLDRALPSEGRGQGFESLRARQFLRYLLRLVRRMSA